MNQKEWFTLYLEAKERHPGMILLIRDGDAYHIFGTDAETVGSVCGLCVLPGSPRSSFCSTAHANAVFSAIR